MGLYPRKPGDTVTLCVPENPRLHGTIATVERAEPWGAHVEAPAAATGKFRALWSEMIDPVVVAGKFVVQGGQAGYTGDLCDNCGGCRMRRSGTCQLCEDCGETSGCS